MLEESLQASSSNKKSKKRVRFSVVDGTDHETRLSAFITTGGQSGTDAPPRPNYVEEAAPRALTTSAKTTSERPQMKVESVGPSTKPTRNLRELRGVVENVDSANGFATVHMKHADSVPVGSKLNVYHRYLLGESLVGQIEVVHTSSDMITTRSINRGPIAQISRGDRVVVAK